MRNVIRRLMGKPVQLSPKQEEKMARIQARADAQIAAQEAKGRKAQVEYAAFAAQNGLAAPPAQPVAAPTSLREIGAVLKQSLAGFQDAVGEMFDDRRDVLDPGDADLNKPIPEVEDPAQRAEIIRAEHEARDGTRAPFYAPEVPHVVFTRFATTGRTQLEDVVSALRSSGFAAHPERVYGVYRVPDRFDHNRNSEAKAYLEWEIAHQPGTLAPATAEILTTGFKRDDHWVARRPGEPSVADEEVAGALIARARVEPEDCYGLHRLMQVRGRDSEDASKSWTPRIEGVLLFSRPHASIAQAQQQLTAEAPLSLSGPPPFRLEILDWEAVAAWVSPNRNGPQRTPSPLPHLPSTWQELLVSYLQIVGVRSEDCYGVQITRTADRSIADLSTASMRQNFRAAPKVPSADGKDRQRLHVAEHLVIAYRDRSEYGAGRARWRAYQHEVLRARLDHLSGERPPIVVDDRPRQSFLSDVVDMFDPFGVPTVPQVFNRNERPSLGPYCGTLD
jgi:hypothetical protein